MKKGTLVSWLAIGAVARGTGVTISDEADGHIQVAVDQGVTSDIPWSYRLVIYCEVAWLTVEVPKLATEARRCCGQ